MPVLEDVEEIINEVTEEPETDADEKNDDPAIIVTIILAVLAVVIVGFGIFVRVQYNIALEEVEQLMLEATKPKAEKTWSA